MDWMQVILSILALLGTGGGGAALLKAWQAWAERKPAKTDNEYLREHYRGLIEDMKKEHEEALLRVMERYLQLKTEYETYVADVKKAKP